MDDVAAFLRATAPFDLLDRDDLEAVAERADVRRASAGETVLQPRAGEPSRHAWVVMEGAIELLEGGRLQDLVGEGEMFGYASMLTQEPVGYVARAAQDSVLARLPEEVVRPILQRPEVVPFLVRSVAGTGPCWPPATRAPTPPTRGRSSGSCDRRSSAPRGSPCARRRRSWSATGRRACSWTRGTDSAS
jgi:hypothetical protein